MYKYVTTNGTQRYYARSYVKVLQVARLPLGQKRGFQYFEQT